MIVNYTDKGWELVTQRAHGLLAAEICAQWKASKRPQRWIEILMATAEHDDVYNEFENDDLLTEQGGPRDFSMTCFEQDTAERLIQMAETKSAFIALLISRHIEFVHGAEPEAKAFCKKLKSREKVWLSVAGCTVAAIAESYALLQFCDAFSLLLCQQLIQPERRSIEISNGPDGQAYEMHAIAKDHITVKPWPFEKNAFEIRFESRLIPQLSFASVKAFRQELRTAAVISHTLQISKL